MSGSESEIEKFKEEIKNLSIEEIKKLKENLEKEKEDLINKYGKEKVEKFHELILNARKYKRTRDKINKKIKHLKAKRRRLNKKISFLERKIKENEEKIKILEKDVKLKKGNVENLMKRIISQIKKIDWYLQTEPVSLRKEEELRRKIDVLEERLSDIKKYLRIKRFLEKDKKDLPTIKKLADNIHEEITSLAKESEENHKKLMEVMDTIKSMEDELKEYIEKSKILNIKLAILQNILSRHAKREEKKSKAVRGQVPPQDEKEDKELREKAKKLYEEFLKGKKLTTEEFIIMQKYYLEMEKGEDETTNK